MKLVTYLIALLFTVLNAYAQIDTITVEKNDQSSCEMIFCAGLGKYDNSYSPSSRNHYDEFGFQYFPGKWSTDLINFYDFNFGFYNGETRDQRGSYLNFSMGSRFKPGFIEIKPTLGFGVDLCTGNSSFYLPLVSVNCSFDYLINFHKKENILISLKLTKSFSILNTIPEYDPFGNSYRITLLVGEQFNFLFLDVDK